MIEKLLQPFKLFPMFFRYGRLKHSARDFNAERKEALANLQSFVPKSSSLMNPLVWFHELRLVLMKNSYLKMLITQSVYFRHSVTPHGGHLHAPFLNLSYIRIPKSASTSISYALLEAMYPGLKAIPLSEKEINFITDANIRRHVGTVDSNDIFFTVVRNPYARLVSVYRDFFGATARDNIYNDYLFGILSADLTFPEFVTRISGIPDLLKDQHFKPQHFFIDFYTRRNPNIVTLKLERVDEVNAFLALYTLEAHVLNKSPQSYDYRAYYDLETFDLVTRMYRQDLKMFNYEQESRKLREYLVNLREA